MPEKTFLLSAGGTGGHLFPAEALAQELLSRGRKIVIVTDRRGEAFKSLGAGVPVHTVRAATLKPGIISKLRAVTDMCVGIVQAACILKKYRPDAVAGFGGYPSFPAVFAAQMMGFPTLLHEQNAILGKANAVLARRAKRIATSLPGTRGLHDRDILKAILTGNPVRPAVLAVRDMPYSPPEKEFRLLVTGGSQGASVFSKVVPAAVALLPEDLRAHLYIVQQARAADVEDVRAAYAKTGVKAEIAPFFSDMPQRLGSCHLLVGRSGASTVAEMAATGRPALFVPFPHKDMQQKFNAEEMVRAGGAWLIMQEDFTPETLAPRLREMIENPAALSRAAEAAKSCGATNAAKKLGDALEGIA
jgi:UDP-N-acetylglucosamine--N-acetylmuramyl-(pentapeptide) pyrophosphoryl-undecaprenol N-acetylglucosamine transferase